MDAKGIERPPGTLEENLFVWMLCRASVPQILVKSFLDCAQYLLDKVPKRMTLGCLRILAALLVIVVPRPVTYVLLYPIFRLVFGNLYPAYASYKAVRTKNVKEYVKWMMYWIVFALFTCAETFTDVFFSFWFPFYYEIKTILVVWLLSPATKGSSILYRRFVHPALIRREAEIDEALARATEQGYTAVLHLGSKGVNYATTVLMQTAIKRLLSSDPTALRELSASQSDSALSSSAKRPAASTPQSEVIQENDHPTTSRTSSSPSLSLDDFVPVEEVPSIHADMNTDNDLYLDAEPATFKVPQPKKTKRSQKTKRERGEPSRKLRSNTQEDTYSNYGYSDDDF